MANTDNRIRNVSEEKSAYKSINLAIKDSNPGDYIHIFPGIYNENIVIEKSITIIGIGLANKIVINNTSTSPNILSGDNIKLENILFEKNTPPDQVKTACIELRNGTSYIKNCIFIGNATTALWGIKETQLVMDNCKIYEEFDTGLFLENFSSIKNTSIHSTKFAGIEITDSGNAIINNNRLNKIQESGILIQKSAQGIITKNEITGSYFAGIEIRNSGTAKIIGNKISQGKQAGINIHTGGIATIEENTIQNNRSSGLVVKDKNSQATIRNNQISKNDEAGIICDLNSYGLLEQNTISLNKFSGIQITNTAYCHISNNLISGNGGGILLNNAGNCLVTENDLRGNAGGPWFIDLKSDELLVKRNNIENTQIEKN